MSRAGLVRPKLKFWFTTCEKNRAVRFVRVAAGCVGGNAAGCEVRWRGNLTGFAVIGKPFSFNNFSTKLSTAMRALNPLFLLNLLVIALPFFSAPNLGLSLKRASGFGGGMNTSLRKPSAPRIGVTILVVRYLLAIPFRLCTQLAQPTIQHSSHTIYEAHSLMVSICTPVGGLYLHNFWLDIFRLWPHADCPGNSGEYSVRSVDPRQHTPWRLPSYQRDAGDPDHQPRWRFNDHLHCPIVPRAVHRNTIAGESFAEQHPPCALPCHHRHTSAWQRRCQHLRPQHVGTCGFPERRHHAVSGNHAGPDHHHRPVCYQQHCPRRYLASADVAAAKNRKRRCADYLGCHRHHVPAVRPRCWICHDIFSQTSTSARERESHLNQIPQRPARVERETGDYHAAGRMPIWGVCFVVEKGEQRCQKNSKQRRSPVVPGFFFL